MTMTRRGILEARMTTKIPKLTQRSVSWRQPLNSSLKVATPSAFTHFQTQHALSWMIFASTQGASPAFGVWV
jgi:hypothetical protein